MGAALALTEDATGLDLESLPDVVGMALEVAANGNVYPQSGRYTYDAAVGTFSYEEYHPFGTSAYRAVDSTIEVSPKRYRYAAAERDEETGLDHMGLRYYAPWLGRWTSADPIGLGDGVNRYAYVHGNPVSMRDPGGTLTEPGRPYEGPTAVPWSDDSAGGPDSRGTSVLEPQLRMRLPSPPDPGDPHRLSLSPRDPAVERLEPTDPVHRNYRGPLSVAWPEEDRARFDPGTAKVEPSVGLKKGKLTAGVKVETPGGTQVSVAATVAPGEETKVGGTIKVGGKTVGAGLEGAIGEKGGELSFKVDIGEKRAVTERPFPFVTETDTGHAELAERKPTGLPMQHEQAALFEPAEAVASPRLQDVRDFVGGAFEVAGGLEGLTARTEKQKPHGSLRITGGGKKIKASDENPAKFDPAGAPAGSFPFARDLHGFFIKLEFTLRF